MEVRKLTFFVCCVLKFIFLVTQARTNGLEGAFGLPWNIWGGLNPPPMGNGNSNYNGNGNGIAMAMAMAMGNGPCVKTATITWVAGVPGGGAHHRAFIFKNKYKIESIICLGLGRKSCVS